MMTLEMRPQERERRDENRGQITAKNLVLVASSAGAPSHSRAPVAGPRGLNISRVAAHTVSSSAAWHRRLARKHGVSPRFAEPIGPASGGISALTGQQSGVRKLLELSDQSVENRDAIAAAIVALRDADAVIAGPFSPDDANAPGMLQHLAALGTRAYRALRPPRELIIHPAFAQVARRFAFIQMSHHEARALGAGAIDIKVLGRRLRGLQGDAGEFAITAVGSQGLLWAEHQWWEIEPLGDVDESTASAVFCMAWVVARQFRSCGVAQALAYARAATIAALAIKRSGSDGLPPHTTGR